MMESIANKVLKRIYCHGGGWAFTPKDFSDCGNRSAIDINLNRLLKKGIIRKDLRGVYDFPRFSKLFNATASPVPEQIAQAIARAYGWSISPSGETALNLLGLSTQVPGKFCFFSDGPSKIYRWNGGELVFKKRAIKETSVLSPRTAILVQALKALGEKNMTDDIVIQLQSKFTKKEIARALRESQFVTGWVYENIKKIADERI